MNLVYNYIEKKQYFKERKLTAIPWDTLINLEYTTERNSNMSYTENSLIATLMCTIEIRLEFFVYDSMNLDRYQALFDQHHNKLEFDFKDRHIQLLDANLVRYNFDLNSNSKEGILSVEFSVVQIKETKN